MLDRKRLWFAVMEKSDSFVTLGPPFKYLEDLDVLKKIGHFEVCTEMKLTVLQCISQYTQFRTMFLWEKMRIIFSKVSALDFSIFFLAIQSSAVVRILHYLPKNWHTFSIILKSLSIQNG